jgi:hypothetical protein
MGVNHVDHSMGRGWVVSSFKFCLSPVFRCFPLFSLSLFFIEPNESRADLATYRIVTGRFNHGSKIRFDGSYSRLVEPLGLITLSIITRPFLLLYNSIMQLNPE